MDVIINYGLGVLQRTFTNSAEIALAAPKAHPMNKVMEYLGSTHRCIIAEIHGIPVPFSFSLVKAITPQDWKFLLDEKLFSDGNYVLINKIFDKLDINNDLSIWDEKSSKAINFNKEMFINDKAGFIEALSKMLKIDDRVVVYKENYKNAFFFSKEQLIANKSEFFKAFSEALNVNPGPLLWAEESKNDLKRMIEDACNKDMAFTSENKNFLRDFIGKYPKDKQDNLLKLLDDNKKEELLTQLTMDCPASNDLKELYEAYYCTDAPECKSRSVFFNLLLKLLWEKPINNLEENGLKVIEADGKSSKMLNLLSGFSKDQSLLDAVQNLANTLIKDESTAVTLNAFIALANDKERQKQYVEGNFASWHNSIKDYYAKIAQVEGAALASNTVCLEKEKELKPHKEKLSKMLEEITNAKTNLALQYQAFDKCMNCYIQNKNSSNVKSNADSFIEEINSNIASSKFAQVTLLIKEGVKIKDSQNKEKRITKEEIKKGLGVISGKRFMQTDLQNHFDGYIEAASTYIEMEREYGKTDSDYNKVTEKYNSIDLHLKKLQTEREEAYQTYKKLYGGYLLSKFQIIYALEDENLAETISTKIGNIIKVDIVGKLNELNTALVKLKRDTANDKANNKAVNQVVTSLQGPISKLQDAIARNIRLKDIFSHMENLRGAISNLQKDAKTNNAAVNQVVTSLQGPISKLQDAIARNAVDAASEIFMLKSNATVSKNNTIEKTQTSNENNAPEKTQILTKKFWENLRDSLNETSVGDIVDNIQKGKLFELKGFNNIVTSMLHIVKVGTNKEITKITVSDLQGLLNSYANRTGIFAELGSVEIKNGTMFSAFDAILKYANHTVNVVGTDIAKIAEEILPKPEARNTISSTESTNDPKKEDLEPEYTTNSSPSSKDVLNTIVTNSSPSSISASTASTTTSSDEPTSSDDESEEKPEVTEQPVGTLDLEVEDADSTEHNSDEMTSSDDDSEEEKPEVPKSEPVVLEQTVVQTEPVVTISSEEKPEVPEQQQPVVLEQTVVQTEPVVTISSEEKPNSSPSANNDQQQTEQEQGSGDNSGSAEHNAEEPTKEDPATSSDEPTSSDDESEEKQEVTEQPEVTQPKQGEFSGSTVPQTDASTQKLKLIDNYIDSNLVNDDGTKKPEAEKSERLAKSSSSAIPATPERKVRPTPPDFNITERKAKREAKKNQNATPAEKEAPPLPHFPFTPKKPENPKNAGQNQSLVSPNPAASPTAPKIEYEYTSNGREVGIFDWVFNFLTPEKKKPKNPANTSHSSTNSIGAVSTDTQNQFEGRNIESDGNKNNARNSIDAGSTCTDNNEDDLGNLFKYDAELFKQTDEKNHLQPLDELFQEEDDEATGQQQPEPEPEPEQVPGSGDNSGSEEQQPQPVEQQTETELEQQEPGAGSIDRKSVEQTDSNIENSNNNLNIEDDNMLKIARNKLPAGKSNKKHKKAHSVPTEQQPQVVPQSQQPQVVPQSQQPQVVPQSQQPQVVPQPQQPQVVPQSQQPQVVPQPQQPQVVPQPQQPQVVPQPQQPQVVPQSQQPQPVEQQTETELEQQEPGAGNSFVSGLSFGSGSGNSFVSDDEEESIVEYSSSDEDSENKNQTTSNKNNNQLLSGDLDDELEGNTHGSGTSSSTAPGSSTEQPQVVPQQQQDNNSDITISHEDFAKIFGDIETKKLRQPQPEPQPQPQVVPQPQPETESFFKENIAPHGKYAAAGVALPIVLSIGASVLLSFLECSLDKYILLGLLGGAVSFGASYATTDKSALKAAASCAVFVGLAFSGMLATQLAMPTISSVVIPQILESIAPAAASMIGM